MAADHRADVVDVDLLHAVAGLQLLRHGAGLHLAVRLTDEHHLLAGLDTQLRHLVDEGLQACLAAASLGHRHQLALVGGVHHRLDGQHGAQKRGGGGHAAAHLQVVQVVHGEPVVDVELVLLHPLHQLLGGQTLPLFLHSQIQQQTLTQRRGQGIHHIHAAVGELVGHGLGGDDRVLIGGGQSAGEVDGHDVLALRQHGTHGVLKLPHVGGGGGAEDTGADVPVELLEADLAAVQQVGVVLAVHMYSQGYHVQLQLLGHMVGQVAAAVSHDDVVAHSKNLLAADGYPYRLDIPWYHEKRPVKREK